MYSLSPPWAFLWFLEVERVAVFQKPKQKPKPLPENRNDQTAIGYDKRQQGKPWTDCGAMDRDSKARQATAREKSLSLFGKDEVGGSNPPSSSTKHLKSSDFGCFFADLHFLVWVRRLTHTVTHTRKRLERFEAHWIGSFASFPVRFLVLGPFLFT